MSLSSPKRNHIPYRQCKLTYYLSDSLQTSSHIVLLANIRGEMNSIDETVNSKSPLYNTLLLHEIYYCTFSNTVEPPQ